MDEAVPLPAWLSVGILSGVGSPDLGKQWLLTLQRTMPVSHCTIFGLSASGRATTIGAASAYGDTAMESAQNYLRNEFDREDPNLRWLARRKTPARPQIWMSQLVADELGSTYRSQCYAELGVRERTSLLLLFEDGGRVALSFYRSLAFAPFSEADLQWLGRSAPLMMAAIAAHRRRTQPDLSGATFRGRLERQLPAREREVLSHVLAGLTMTEIAVRMRLAVATVITYRYRAFTKLGIRTHRELLALVSAHRPTRAQS